ncbi:uncharacterized protein LOC110104273 [Dendrobium catenatum]|uniref:Serine/threonine-protein phosphatase 7 long form like n=1 Tax=Dendrobium catenatum TaxID=906689 RepID=A0A2I0VNB7_9ASPA|nr:uncharacterized protein LOC110104273 [Dendrobium catenatum]PKU64906.1 Serine/threonine-protein phosphatase 7 long form like [Dendrobium catenatum]
MGDEKKDLCLVEEREAEMVAFAGSSEPYKRNGYFLNPILKNAHAIQEALSSPPQRRTISVAPFASSTVHFKGWACPQRQWGKWVDKLQPIYEDLWKKSGIFDAIKSSTYKIRRELSSILGAAAFWCEETNTFLFPWSEATITLEDVMILGGFPVTGEPLKKREAFEGDLLEMEKAMIAEHRKFNKTKWRKADQTLWTRQFMEREGDELEHIGFLSLWLSRYVFPRHPDGIVGQYVIPIAVRLSRGVRISIATAVLASLYRDLRILKDYLHKNGGGQEAAQLVLWAPFSILQMWLWERFVALRPEALNYVNSGEPRVARWHDSTKKLELSFVISVMELPDSFQWRPYAISLDSWCMPSFYKEMGEWVCSGGSSDDEFGSFARCLRPCELVGLDCIEQYLPHWVAMQFGLDQDIPNNVTRANSSWEAAWDSFDTASRMLKFFAPPRLYESDVTARYSVWWKHNRVTCSNVVRVVAGPSMPLKMAKKSEKEMVLEKPGEDVEFLAHEEDLQNKDDFALVNNDNEKVYKRKGVKPLEITTQGGTHKKLKLSVKGWEKMKQNTKVSRKSKTEKKRRYLKDFAFDLAGNVHRETLDDFDGKEVDDFAPIAFKDFGETTVHSGFRTKNRKEVIRLIGEDSQLEMQIKALKKEIAGIQAKLMNLESLQEEQSKSEVSSSDE